MAGTTVIDQAMAATLSPGSLASLAYGDRVITLLMEVLGHSHYIGNGFPEFVAETPDACGGRAQAGHDTGTRRRARGVLTVGVGKEHGFPGKGIKVWRLDIRIAVAPHFRPEVIYDDKEDIWFPLRLLAARQHVGILTAS